ncbi:hypothetical protein MHB44_10565 [Lysinibacillus sp. FSL H8-0500]|uniref:hypothetical protein n=1 Tax=Lysinibacillus sp. FSL H8-0500 TaxID=2921393 RepID=UPI0031012839
MTPFTSWLRNELRPYFGLQLLDKYWGILQIREDYFICLEGDIIKKEFLPMSNTIKKQMSLLLPVIVR